MHLMTLITYTKSIGFRTWGTPDVTVVKLENCYQQTIFCNEQKEKMKSSGRYFL